MPHPRLLTLASASLLIAVLIALAVLAWRGSAARYVTDDYCSAATLQDLGFLRAQQYHRESWSGRFSYYALKAVFESIGPITPRFTPGLLLLLFVAAMSATLWRVARPLEALTAGAALVFATIQSSPGFWDAYLWETGSLTYTLPLVVLAAWSALFSSSSRTAIRCVISAALLFFAGGLSETTLAVQAAVAGGVAVWALLRHDRRALTIALSGLAATMVALAIVATASGNAARASTLPPRRPLFEAGLDSLALANTYIGSYALGEWTVLLLAFVAGALIPVRIRTAAAIAVVATAAYVTSFFPSAWIQSAAPPTRALHVSHFFLLVVIAAGGAAASARLRRPAAIAVLLLLVSIVPIAATRDRLPEIAAARREAAKIDALDAWLRRRRGEAVTLRERWVLDSGFLRAEPDHWVNECVSRYYRLRSLTVVPPAASDAP